MIEHFDCATFKNVFLRIVGQSLCVFSFLFILSCIWIKSINGINIDALANLLSFFDKIFWIFLSFVEGLEQVNVDNRGLFLVSKSDQFMIRELVSEAKLV